ncbi:putative glycosyltransferase [Cavenderia fasciculata]|uniref:Glycosyltransferase n=1 Tax=Cavenderia fasciculata TaxID=261658 RepID=F4PGS6_CACFS|nr:putative glycosyltransferase [Cavenderia fasciculata]EGG24910.1 putative glycosyltransferase [Cavenderia fasciculata]|eukprot:XP_004362761.1 putative glycosyltransferase [Cavenderia fasciculata]
MSDWLVSPSNYMLNWMRRNGWILPRNSYVHQNLLPPAQVDSNNIDREMTRSFDEIIFFGRLESRKGLDVFIKAVERLVDRLRQESVVITFLGANTKLTEINMMADHYIANKCNRLEIKCHILIGKSHTEAIQYLTFDREKKLVVIPSPIDNSPNTVLECLTHRLAFIASQVGGIPELIHPEDRDRSLFIPKPASLVKKLSACLDQGVKPARMAIDEWTRQRIWSNWHSVVHINGAQSQQDDTKNGKITLKKISIVLVYDETNQVEFIKALQSLDDQMYADESLEHLRIELVIAISTFSTQAKKPRAQQQQYLAEFTSTLQMASLQQPKVATVSEFLVDQWFQPWNSKSIHETVTGDFVLFIDKYDWPSLSTLRTLIQVEEFTNADLISSSLQYDNISKVSSITGVYMGCLGMNGILYNCYGANNVFMKRSVLDAVGRRYENKDVEDELDYGGAWELYAETTNKGYNLETIPNNLFFTNKFEVDGSSTYNQELRVMKYFEAILPPTMGLAPLATRHFLISKNVYLNEIINVQQRSKQLQQQCDKGKGGIKEISSDIISLEDMESTTPNPMMESRDHIGLLFVRGHEKSGTSWLKKVLNLHPRILLAQQEFHFHLLEDALDKFTDSHWAAAREPYISLTRKWYRSFVRNLVLSGVSPATAPLISWVGEKTPSPLSPLISGARYIVIMRDGRDVLVSLFWHYVRLGGFENWCGGQSKYLVDPVYVNGYKSDPLYFKKHPGQLLDKEVCFRHVAKSWATRAREDFQLVESLGEMKNPPTKVHIVRYEELHRFPEETRAEMYRFLNLDPDEAEPLSTDDKTSPGGFQEEGDSKNKFFRKGEIGDWQNYFTKNQKQWFKEEAGSILVQLGYELDNNW